VYECEIGRTNRPQLPFVHSSSSRSMNEAKTRSIQSGIEIIARLNHPSLPEFDHFGHFSDYQNTLCNPLCNLRASLVHLSGRGTFAG